MKKLILLFTFTLINTPIFAQWEQVNNGIGSTSVTSMFSWVDTLMVGTAGGGIFKTEDNGESWIDISGNIGNLNVNDIRGGAGPKVIWAATEGGPFLTQDHANYSDNTSTGLTTTDINYYYFGGGSDETEWAIGTNGGGVFTSPEVTGPWTSTNTGVSGNGLIVNDMGGYDDDEISYAVMATDGGVYFSTDDLATWTEKNNGLTGDALLVKRLTGLGSVVIVASHGGLFMTLDSGDSWLPIIENERFNTITIVPSLFMLFVFGETGYFSADFQNYIPFDMTGITGGDVTSVALTSSYIFVGTETGGVFRLSVDYLSIDEEHTSIPSEYKLEQNFPNPFNPATTIAYSLNQFGTAKLVIYDFTGKEIETLFNKEHAVGDYQVEWSAEGLASGIYFYSLIIDNKAVKTRKMILLK